MRSGDSNADILLDDRAVVELLGDAVRCRPDQLDAALAPPTVGVGAGERRQERVVDVDRRHPHPLQEIAAEYLHVARQDWWTCPEVMRLTRRVRRAGARDG